MKIDEAIEKYKDIANTDDNCPLHCMRPCEDCVQQSEQIAEWLEELKAIKSDGFTDDLLNIGFTKGYNKAIDDFMKRIDEEMPCDICDGEEALFYVKEVVEQLKEGERMKLTNEICISFLMESGWLYNHDKEITISERNKAIDDFVKMCDEAKVCETYYCVSMGDIRHIAELLKAGVESGTDNQ